MLAKSDSLGIIRSRPGTLGGFGDSAERKTAFRIIDRIIGNGDCRCAAFRHNR